MSSAQPHSSFLHNEMNVRERKTSIICGFYKQSGHNQYSCQNKNKGDQGLDASM